jgi:hypothetical protein
MGRHVRVIEVFKNVVMDVMAPLSDALGYVADHRIAKMIETRKHSPPTRAGIGVCTVNHNVVDGLKGIKPHPPENAASDGVICLTRARCARPSVNIKILKKCHPGTGNP